MFQLLISPLVYEDINEIREYISDELYNPQAADELINQIKSNIRDQSSFEENIKSFILAISLFTLLIHCIKIKEKGVMYNVKNNLYKCWA